VSHRDYPVSTQTTKPNKEVDEQSELFRHLTEILEDTIPVAFSMKENGPQGASQGVWTIRENTQLLKAIHVSKPRNWQWIASVVGTRSQGQCQKRWKKVEVLYGDKEGMVKLIRLFEESKNLD
jgi:hypothetical protein